MRARLVTVAVWMLVSLHAPGAWAQAPAGQSAAPSSSTATPPPAARDQSPVAVPEPSEKAMARYRSGIVLWVADTVWGFVLPALILFTGVSARMRDWAVRIGRKRFFIIAIYFAIFSVITYLIDLPRAYYEEFVREHAYGLSNQTFTKWISDSVTALAVSLVIGALFLWVPYLLLRKSPRRWWLYTSLLAVPFLMLIIVVTPIFIEPLFNKFGPMKNKTLEQHILQLANRAGIEGGRVYEVDKSTDTKALNAYVTGLGTTKRIVPVGHDHRAAGRTGAAVRDGARDGPLRAGPHLEVRDAVLVPDPGDVVRDPPYSRVADHALPGEAGVHRASPTSRRCRFSCSSSAWGSSWRHPSRWPTAATPSTRPIASASRSRATTTPRRRRS
jgi:hypothetical protein